MEPLLCGATASGSRRDFLRRTSLGLGVAALHWLGVGESTAHALGSLPGLHFAPRAKRVIYLFQSGGPSQLELLDPKPGLAKLFDADLPDSVRMGQRITGMVTAQKRLPIAPSKYGF
jgi:hypothetical protein